MITPPRRRFTRTVSVLLAWVSLGLGLLTGANAQAPQTLSADAQTRASAQIEALGRDKAARTPAQRKMDAHLIHAAREAQGRLAVPGAPRVRSGVAVSRDRLVELDVQGAISENLLAAIRTAGGRVVNAHPEYHAARVFLPLEAIEGIAGREDVRFIRPAVRAEHNTGKVDSEGDATHQASNARTAYNVTGLGVTVGVLSDSIDDGGGSYAAAVKSGDIDGANTSALQGQEGSGEGEGLAMCEIVHDIVPGAKIIFATGEGGEAQMAANIVALADAGCDVIIDDLTYGDEPPFQDGIISQAVNSVSARGVLYFSSARNSGNFDQGTASVWEGDYKQGPPANAKISGEPGNFHLFTAADGSTNYLNFIKDNGQAGSVTLFWSDPLGASTNDYDVFELDSAGDVIAYSNNVQDGTGDPYEDTFSYAIPGDYVAIVKSSGSSRFVHVEVGRLELGGANTNGCVRGHNAAVAANAYSVAATPAHGPFYQGQPSGPYPNAFNANNVTETFSSDGPRRMFYMADGTPYTPGNYSSTGGKVFPKPDLTAADGVITTLPVDSGLNPFYGTSAAAPHAGALAAMVISKYPSLTPSQIGAALRAGVVVPAASTGETKNTYGAGILLEPKVFAAAAGPTAPPSITSALTATAIRGQPFTYTITATNNPTSFGVQGLPTWLKLNATTGLLSGTPPNVGTFTLTLHATNVLGTDTKTLKLTVKLPALTITSPATAAATEGQVFTYQITATNNPTSFGAQGLPPGLKVNVTTGVISGTPTTFGTKTITLHASNAAGSATKMLTLTIQKVALTITSAGTATATESQKFTYQVTATNSPMSFGADGLPPDLIINGTTGLISGVPSVSGTYAIVLHAYNSDGSASKNLTLTIKQAPPVITSPSTASGKKGVAFTYTITATNQPTSFGVQGLPQWLKLTVNAKAHTATLTGTPPNAGSYNMNLKASNATGSDTQTLTIIITAK